MNKCCDVFLMLIFLIPASVMAQTGSATPPVSTVFAVLTKAVESKSATAGQELTLRTISDVVVDGEVVIPRGAKVLGHVSGVSIKGQGVPRSVLSIVIDKVATKDGVEIPVKAIIAAVAAPPQNSSLSSDPTYGMLHSMEPNMVGAGAGSATRAGGLQPGSKAGSTAAVATADIKGRMDESPLLREDSQGAVGYEGLSLSWQLTNPPPATVFDTKAKNLRLEAGTQMLLRMAAPRLAR